ncbi:unnamed protein product [Allacma fusca]|uniref:Heat shock protein 70 n=1 Tax=Allacma fusca TaxID=39272 RepID=A0A8J2PEM0_9HEXA|nr:unnamed protein product [Allacma fusca]
MAQPNGQEFTIVIGKGCSKLFKNSSKYDGECMARLKHHQLFLSKERILKLEPNRILEIENSIFDILLLFGKEFDGSAHISERIIENSDLIRKYHNEVHICIDQEFYTPFEIISKIFYQLRRLASIPEDVSIRATVVYPFNYDEQVLEELKISFTKTLNIKVVGFLNYDIAIAYNHFNQNRVEIKSRTILTVHCNSRALAFSLFRISQDPHQLEIVWTAQSLIHGIYDGFRDALLKHCVNKFRQYFQEDLQEHDLKKPLPLRCWRVKKLENLRKQCWDVTSNFLIHGEIICKIDLLVTELDCEFLASTNGKIKKSIFSFDITHEQFEEFNAHNYQTISKEIDRITLNHKVDDVVVVGLQKSLLKDWNSKGISQLVEYRQQIAMGSKPCSVFFSSLELMEMKRQKSRYLKIISEISRTGYLSMLENVSLNSQVEKKKNDISEVVLEGTKDSETQQMLESAYQKAQGEFASFLYKERMREILANPDFIPVRKLHTHHEDVIKSCLEAVNKVKPSTDQQIIKFKEHFAAIYEDTKKTNQKKLESKAQVLGIDIGTTYCCVAYFNKDSEEVQTIVNECGKNTTPSYVQLNDDNEIIVGGIAEYVTDLNVKDTIFDIKRMYGRHFEEEEIQKLKKYWPFQVVHGEDGKIKILFGQEVLYPEELLVNLVNHLKVMAEEYLDEMVINAVIAIPAYFNRRQRFLTTEACNKAGLNVIRFISEPAAAGLTYSSYFKKQKGKQTCLIFDLGGGALNVAILEIGNEIIKILATDGDPNVGGRDFTNSILQHCVDTFKKENGVDLMEVGSYPERSMRLKRMTTECEKMKCSLSETKKVCISVVNIYYEKSLTVLVTRDEVSELIRPYIDKCMKVVDQVLANCQRKEADIDDVMLVGGSTRIPYVQERLSEKFGESKLMKLFKQQGAVAHGAALLAYSIENQRDVVVQELDRRF